MHRGLLETDQVHCYTEDGRLTPCDNNGQDASRGKKKDFLAQDRFQKMDHTVRDHLTGAVWTRNTSPTEYPLTCDEALAFVLDMCTRRVHGYSDWRLPPRRLLFSLISHQNVNPSLFSEHPFENVFPGYFWTEETFSRLPDQAWYIHLGGGRIHHGMKQGSYMVWPVSTGEHEWVESIPKANIRFTVDEGCVRDRQTGLIWSKDANPAGGPLTWQDALSTVDALNSERFGGQRDWRMPNIREIESLVDLETHSPALSTGHPFVNVQDAYWSSTTSVYEPRYAWTLYSRDGIIGVGFKPGNDFFLWPVCCL